MEHRIFQHAKIKDVVTIVKSSEDTHGCYILLEVQLAPGGGNITHYHTSLSEEFIPIAGVLALEVNGTKMLIRPGRKAIATMGQRHRFFNPGKTIITFQVKITPGDKRCTDSLKIGYGLALDGKTTQGGIPRNINHLAFLLELSDTRFTGFLSLIQQLLLRYSKKGQKKVREKLYRLYCS